LVMTIATNRKACNVSYLGITPYEAALRLQEMLVRARGKGDIPDVLLLLQHPPVFTVGRFRGEEDVLVPPEILAQQGIAVVPTNRGGGITYHGPGQLVGYPIFNLRENRLGVREFIWRLEEFIISLLLTLGIQGHRVDRYPGSVWVDKKKVCSIGIHVGNYITMHGFALNVNTDLQPFEYINPCGTKGNIMTSISKVSGYPVEPEAIIEALLDSFSEIFGLRCERGDNKWLATSGVLIG